MPILYKPKARADLENNLHSKDIHTHEEHIREELEAGFDLLQKYPKSVTIFGSSLIKPESPIYKQATEIGGRIHRETGYAVITGGGPGIMEASNKGAFEAGGASIGLNVSLPHDRMTNSYLTDETKFSYFFLRKTMMMFTAEAFVFMPGGFGTLDELFGVLTLIQTDKIPHVPIILFGSEYWNEMLSFMRKTMMQKYGTIREKDLHLFVITDSIDEVISTIKKAPVSDWWRNIN